MSLHSAPDKPVRILIFTAADVRWNAVSLRGNRLGLLSAPTDQHHLQARGFSDGSPQGQAFCEVVTAILRSCLWQVRRIYLNRRRRTLMKTPPISEKDVRAR